jgi:hypothetical protein
LSLPLPVLCLLSRLLTLVVWCVWLVVFASVACGLPWVVLGLLLPCLWLLLSGLLVPLVLPWTCGVRLVVPVCLAPVTSALCLFVDRSSSVASACAVASVVVCLGLPVGAFALFLLESAMSRSVAFARSLRASRARRGARTRSVGPCLLAAVVGGRAVKALWSWKHVARPLASFF